MALQAVAEPSQGSTNFQAQTSISPGYADAGKLCRLILYPGLLYPFWRVLEGFPLWERLLVVTCQFLLCCFNLVMLYLSLQRRCFFVLITGSSVELGFGTSCGGLHDLTIRLEQVGEQEAGREAGGRRIGGGAQGQKGLCNKEWVAGEKDQGCAASADARVLGQKGNVKTIAGIFLRAPTQLGGGPPGCFCFLSLLSRVPVYAWEHDRRANTALSTCRSSAALPP